MNVIIIKYMYWRNTIHESYKSGLIINNNSIINNNNNNNFVCVRKKERRVSLIKNVPDSVSNNSGRRDRSPETLEFSYGGDLQGNNLL